MRFPNEDVSRLTMQQLRGREGSRIRNVYKKASEEWNIPWNGRCYDPEQYETGDDVNKALSAGHACLYGLAHAVIFALGCSPGLGFVHVGHERSFVYDIADLYKAEITIPAAFEVAAKHSGSNEIGTEMRRVTRSLIYSSHLLERMVKDIKYLLNDTQESGNTEEVTIELWDNQNGSVPYGTQYWDEDDKGE